MAYTRKISASQINLYHECPRRFYYKYVLKIKEPPSEHLIKGSFFHSIVERFFDLNPRRCDINLRNYKTEFYTYANDVFEQVLNEPRIVFGRPMPSYKTQLDEVYNYNDFDVAKALVDVKKIMYNWLALYLISFETYSESAMGFAQAYYMSCPARNELEIKHPKIIGYIDEVIKKDDMVIIRDLKTSKIYKCSFNDEYERQIKLYCYGYNYMYDEIPTIGSVFFARYGIESLYKFDKNNIIQEMEDLINWFTDVIISKDIESYLCNHQYQFCTSSASLNPNGFKNGKTRCYYDRFCNQEIAGFDIDYNIEM